MATRKRAAGADVSRLKVLAAGPPGPFLAQAAEVLASRDRLAREGALELLAERPLAEARDMLRRTYDDLDADGMKRDQGGRQRTAIVRALRGIGDGRDADIALRACDAREVAFGSDLAWGLRAHGLMLLAELDPEAFPYIAVEHLNDNAGIDGEPAHTAFRLLAERGQFVALYQWLMEHDANAAVFQLLTGAPSVAVRRFVALAVGSAVRQQDEAMCMLLAETIVEQDLADAYGELEGLLAAKVSDELYGYLAMLMAATNRAPLLAMLERQLHSGRRPRIIAEALRVRTTDEQAAILRRWEEGEER